MSCNHHQATLQAALSHRLQYWDYPKRYSYHLKQVRVYLWYPEHNLSSVGSMAADSIFNGITCNVIRFRVRDGRIWTRISRTDEHQTRVSVHLSLELVSDSFQKWYASETSFWLNNTFPRGPAEPTDSI